MTATETALFRADLDAIGYAALALIVVVALFWAIGSALLRNTPAGKAGMAPQRRRAGANADEADMARQIATLRKDADAAVAQRPRVRAHGAPLAGLHTESASALWLRGVCCHSADCADVHCPGRLQARLDGAYPVATKTPVCKPKQPVASVKRSFAAIETEAKRTGT